MATAVRKKPGRICPQGKRKTKKITESLESPNPQPRRRCRHPSRSTNPLPSGSMVDGSGTCGGGGNPTSPSCTAQTKLAASHSSMPTVPYSHSKVRADMGSKPTVLDQERLATNRKGLLLSVLMPSTLNRCPISLSMNTIPLLGVGSRKPTIPPEVTKQNLQSTQGLQRRFHFIIMERKNPSLPWLRDQAGRQGGSSTPSIQMNFRLTFSNMTAREQAEPSKEGEGR
jgi:hypothetical protein